MKGWLDLLVCPQCRGGLDQRLLDGPPEDPIEGVLTCDRCRLWFPIRNRIPRLFRPGPLRPEDSSFVNRWRERVPDLARGETSAAPRTGQAQVQTTFGYKWNRQTWWGMEGASARHFESWLLPRYGWNSSDEYVSFLRPCRRVLDAGSGLGRETLRVAHANPAAEVLGIELSDCVDEAQTWAIKKSCKNVHFIQADLNEPPLPDAAFDFVISEGVLHHTGNTQAAFASISRLVRPGGQIGFYVYARKAPLREFADDHVRAQLQDLPPEEAWTKMESLTRLGKTLSDLKVRVDIEEDVSVLGIRAGQYDLQRFIYYDLFKCYWNEAFSFEENVHVNFDWYAPRFSWRHTPEEVRGWIASAGWALVHEHLDPSGITVRARRP